MGFLQPVLLALGIVAAVPILLHLLQRHQGPRVVFPALRYLRRAESEHARRIRFRQLLLMLLRVGAIVLLAAAAARPFLRARGASHSPTAVAIVLDNSMSTGAVSGEVRVLDDLKARALETLDAAIPQDRFWLIRAGAPWEPAWPGSATRTADLVRETTASWAAADLPAAVERARAVLEAGADGRAPEIHVLTDRQATALTGPAPVPPEAVRLLVWAPPGSPPANRSVVAVEIGGGAPPPAGLRTTAAVTVAGAPDSTAAVRLAVNGRVVGAARAGTGSSAVLALPAFPPGLVSGWAETDPDALRADDRRYFALRIPEPPGVATTSDLGIAATALDVLAESGRLRRTRTADADLVFSQGLSGTSVIDPRATIVVLPPDSDGELPGMNRALADAGIAWRLERGAVGESRLMPRASDPLTTQLSTVRIIDSYRLVPTAETGAAPDSVLLRLDDGAAWAVRGQRRGGARYILLGSSLSETATSLPVSAALVPFMVRLTGLWAFGAEVGEGLAPGTEVTRPAAVTAVELPDGTVEAVTAGSAFRPTDAGVYRFLADDSAVEAFAVNPPAAESDLRRVEPDGMSDVFPGYDIALPGEDWTDAIYGSRLGREAWRFAAVVAVIVLLIESLLAAAGARAGSRRGAGPAGKPMTT